MTYWHFTFLNKTGNFGWGIKSFESEYFDFLWFHETYPENVLLSVNTIDMEQAFKLNKLIESMRNNGE